MKKVFVAGHAGLVGSSVCASLEGYQLVTRTRAELDLEDRQKTTDFLMTEKPNYVVLCAAKVGGIYANSTYPVEFLHNNLNIQLNVIEAAFKSGVDKLIFMGSSCIYPRDCLQPISENYLLTGPLESTNRPYALAKIAGIESCWSYNRQYGTKYIALMPTNMYGPCDNYHPENSHVLPALIRRFHEAKNNKAKYVTVWGSGKPRREFLYSSELGVAVKFLLEMKDEDFDSLVSSDVCPLINVGTGEDLTIKELAELIRETVGYDGDIIFDDTKPDGTPRKLLDVSKINALGWKAKIKLKDGLKMAYNDFLERKI
jgi:GDP-L-fucose synthase